jgi:hypothetical protein
MQGMMKKIGLMLFVGLFLAGAAWAGTVEMVLYGLSGREREEDWRVLGEGLVEKGVRVESTDAERARVVIWYDEEVLFPKRSAKVRLRVSEVEKRLGQLVREASMAAFDLRSVSAGGCESGYIARELRIGVLDCKGCRYGAYTLAMRVEGVERVWVDAERAVLRFTYHPGRVGRLYSGFFEPEWIVSELVKSSLRKGRVEVLD